MILTAYDRFRGQATGWTHTPTVAGKVCRHCGARHNDIPGRLVSPSGRSWPLIGNRTPAAEREMVKAIIEAHPEECAA